MKKLKNILLALFLFSLLNEQTLQITVTLKLKNKRIKVDLELLKSFIEWFFRNKHLLLSMDNGKYTLE